MHAEVFRAFDALCADEGAGGAILEIGATPDMDTLLRLPSIANAASRTGINLDGDYADSVLQIVAGNANAMAMFADASFDVVLCNAVLEHDQHFWLTLSEIRRVARPGALVAIGVPAYGEQGDVPFAHVAGLLKRVPGAARVAETLRASAATLGRHDFPGDYYRFSRAAVEAVLLEGCESVRSRTLLSPPRVIGWGRRAGSRVA